MKPNQTKPNQTKPLQIIYDDLFRITGKKDVTALIKQFLLNPGFKFMVYFRLRKESNYILKLISKINLFSLSRKYHFQIPYMVEIGKGFNINHWGPVVINPKAKIGKNVNIHQGVVIGQQNRGIKKGAPIIGDEVWIGANTVIVGAIKIGNNVLIAPNAYVNFDVPCNSIVIGNPARIIVSEKATEDYINRIV